MVQISSQIRAPDEARIGAPVGTRIGAPDGTRIGSPNTPVRDPNEIKDASQIEFLIYLNNLPEDKAVAFVYHKTTTHK